MSDPSAILTQLTSITITNGSGTPVTIGGADSIKGIGSGKAKAIDITTFSSTAVESVPGLQNYGTVMINFSRRNQDDLGQAEITSAENLQSVRQFVVTLTTSAANVITFSGWVESFTTDIDKDGAVIGVASVHVTGKPVYT